MAEITVDESWREIRALIGRAEQAADERRWTDAIEVWREVLAHPCAHHQVAAYEILDEIHQTWRQAGRFADAIAAKRAAIAAGYRSVPDPEADIAECLLAAGRRGEADALFATLREREPEDVWLYNAAAYSYADVDMGASLRWALDGIDVAFATGDPDQVVMQLLECAEAAWKALGDPPDEELVERVETFCENWTPPAVDHRWFGNAPPFEDRPCGHCGYQPQTSRLEQQERARRARRRLLEAEDPQALARLDATFEPATQAELSGPMPLAVGWFPADQWAQAIERWPDLLEELPADHRDYSHATEARIKRIARHVPGNRLHVAALTVDGLVTHAEAAGYDSGTAEARSSYAAKLLEAGDALIWPPGRNEPCWCGSARKYKKCCGRVPAAADSPE
jgi:tetratricopeptide (TPR) repeat protein